MGRETLERKEKGEVSELKNSFQYDQNAQSKGRENKAEINERNMSVYAKMNDVNPSPCSWPNNFQVSNDAFKVQEGPMTISKSKKLQEAC